MNTCYQLPRHVRNNHRYLPVGNYLDDGLLVNKSLLKII